MDKSTFLYIWNALEEWTHKTKKLYELGIDSARYDKNLYGVIIQLMSQHFDEEQMDMIVWSIFDDDKQLMDGEQPVKIDNAEMCWEYVNKLKNEQTENNEIPS